MTLNHQRSSFIQNSVWPTTCFSHQLTTSVSCYKRQTSASEKVSLSTLFFFFCTKRTVFFFSFFFFSPNPVKLFLRADQCLHTSLLQLINDYPLIPLLSALFICLLLLPVILPCLLLLCPRSHRSPPSPLPPFSNLTIKDLCIHNLHNWLDYRTVGPRLQWFCISFVIFVSLWSFLCLCGHLTSLFDYFSVSLWQFYSSLCSLMCFYGDFWSLCSHFVCPWSFLSLCHHFVSLHAHFVPLCGHVCVLVVI